MCYRPGWLFVLLVLISCKTFADLNNNFCTPDNLLTIINRPTVADSPCAVSEGRMLLESGYQYQHSLYQGHLQNFPASELRLGVPVDSEFYVLLPEYVTQSDPSYSGFGPVSLGAKHEMAYTRQWIVTLDGLITPPSGSKAFGSKGVGGFLAGIFSYNLGKTVSFTAMLSVSTATLSSLVGGQRFTSVNPDAFFTWSPKSTLQIYAEVYGQSKTGPGMGSGFNMSLGLIYLVAKNITWDIEANQRLRGVLGGFENYVATGLVIQF
ncbi:hypothetical protein [Legionella fairfieldensis]|uniref:hypothetical protein n=1 Tax=Legionella fairfieldensis TaxID=45064 RepID=UPI00068838F3|nr:hypothetical protein [Legionella fairfieldensis]